MGILTALPAQHPLITQVLNAFRHHGNSHLRMTGSTPHSQCAQRLSASWEFSPPSSCWERTTRRVLNAFRHHGNSHDVSDAIKQHLEKCSTPFGIMGILTQLHQKFRVPIQMCSTPFGIMGILTALVTTHLFAASCKSVFAHLFVLL